MSRVKPIPDGFHSINVHLCVNNAVAALEFYKKAFGAVETMRIVQPDGRVGHAELSIGDSRVMLADEFPELNARSPRTIGGTPVSIMLYVEDVDRVFDQAVSAGATVKRSVEDQFYGDRMGGIEDPFGHVWWISTHKEDVPEDELKRRAAQADH
jgi:PhnB protein